MSVLYVQKQGAKLTKSGGRINVVYEEKVINSLPNMKIDSIVLFGSIKITTPLIKWLLGQGIPVAFMTVNGQFCGKLTGKINPDFVQRYRQYQILSNPDNRLILTKKIISSKIKNTIDLLSVFNKRRKIFLVETAIDRLNENLEKIITAQEINVIRGIEGNSAKIYFSVFGKLINPDSLIFNYREKRGAKNPINSMLNYNYGVLLNFIISLIEMAGLDPYQGIFHSPRYNRPSLALDLMENFRSICDRIVLTLINKNMVDFDNFDFDNHDYVLISPKTRQLMLEYFEKKLGITSCYIESNPVMHQIRSLQHFIKGKSENFESYEIVRV